MPPYLEKDYDGYWGRPTATIDWCESNYEVTPYVAEFWNTITNLSMIIPPLFGIIQAYLHSYELRAMGMYVSLMVVGIGSVCFHGTLLYGMQMLDELPMIWGSSFLLYAMKEVDTRRNNILLQTIIFLYCLVVTVIYVTINQPIFHEVAYGIMVVTMVLYSIKIKRKHAHSGALFYSAVLIYGGGFLIWNLDNVYCNQIRSYRNTVPKFTRPLLQGHGWWHIFAGFGTYYCITFATHARLLFLNKKCELKTCCWGIIPYVTVTPKSA